MEKQLQIDASNGGRRPAAARGYHRHEPDCDHSEAGPREEAARGSALLLPARRGAIDGVASGASAIARIGSLRDEFSWPKMPLTLTCASIAKPYQTRGIRAKSRSFPCEPHP